MIEKDHLGRRWLPHRLSKRQSLTTVLLRTPITQMIFFSQGKTDIGVRGYAADMAMRMRNLFVRPLG